MNQKVAVQKPKKAAKAAKANKETGSAELGRESNLQSDAKPDFTRDDPSLVPFSIRGVQSGNKVSQTRGSNDVPNALPSDDHQLAKGIWPR